MINKEEGINHIKTILHTHISKYYRKSYKGRPNVLSIDDTLNAIFLCSC